MADDNRNNDDDRQRKSGDFKMPSRNWIVWILIFCCVIVVVLFHNQMEPQGDQISQYDFKQLVDSNMVVKALIKFNPQSPFKGSCRHLLQGRGQGRQEKPTPAPFPRQGFLD